MPINRKKGVPTQLDRSAKIVNSLHLLPAARTESQSHNVIIITNLEDLRCLLSEIVDQHSNSEPRTEREPLLVSISVAAKLLSVSEKTIMRRIVSGELEGVKEGDVLRVTMASIKKYIERNRIAVEEEEDEQY